MSATNSNRTRVRAPATRRGDLLAAATALFVQNGYEGTTVADITEAAGVAKGTFYLYFATKEQLLDGLRVYFVEDLAARLNEVQRPTKKAEWRDFMHRLVQTAIDVQVEQRDLHDVVVHGPHTSVDSPEGGSHIDPIRAELISIIRRGVDASVFKVYEIEVATDLIYDFLHAAGDRACHHSANTKTIVEMAATMTWRSLTGKA
jgi:AcrR family transcriptional regulator